MFVVPSAAKMSMTDVRSQGIEGIHFAYDYPGLCKMIEKYGINHAPNIKNAQDVPEELAEDKKRTVQEIHEWMFTPDEASTTTVSTATATNSATSNEASATTTNLDKAARGGEEAITDNAATNLMTSNEGEGVRKKTAG